MIFIASKQGVLFIYLYQFKPFALSWLYSTGNNMNIICRPYVIHVDLPTWNAAKIGVRSLGWGNFLLNDNTAWATGACTANISLPYLCLNAWCVHPGVFHWIHNACKETYLLAALAPVAHIFTGWLVCKNYEYYSLVETTSYFSVGKLCRQWTKPQVSVLSPIEKSSLLPAYPHPNPCTHS